MESTGSRSYELLEPEGSVESKQSELSNKKTLKDILLSELSEAQIRLMAINKKIDDLRKVTSQCGEYEHKNKKLKIDLSVVRDENTKIQSILQKQEANLKESEEKAEKYRAREKESLAHNCILQRKLEEITTENLVLSSKVDEVQSHLKIICELLTKKG